jgi:hypothetical protein
MQQFGKLSDIGYRRIGRAHGVDDATLVGADMQLHPEVPIPPLPGLLHLGVASRSSIFGGTGRRDNGGVHDRSRTQQQTASFEQAADRVKDRAGKLVLLQQMPKAQDAGLIRY